MVSLLWILNFRYFVTGIVKRNLSDSVNETLLSYQLRFEKDQNGEPQTAPTFAFENISFPIVDMINLFRSLLSVVAQGYVVSRRISTAALPRFTLGILKGVAPIFHWILGESPDAVKGTHYST